MACVIAARARHTRGTNMHSWYFLIGPTFFFWLLNRLSTHQDEWGSDAQCPDRCDELAAAAAKSASQAMEGSRVRQALCAGEGMRRWKVVQHPVMQEKSLVILTSCQNYNQIDMWSDQDEALSDTVSNINDSYTWSRADIFTACVYLFVSAVPLPCFAGLRQQSTWSPEVCSIQRQRWRCVGCCCFERIPEDSRKLSACFSDACVVPSFTDLLMPRLVALWLMTLK